ncbi:MAG: site-specific DNA-methyltransferase [Patescibacteria group bacterium]
MQKPKSYNITPARGQALLNYQGRLLPSNKIEMQLFETKVIEEIKQNRQKKQKDKQKELNTDFKNLLLHGDCLSACAYLKSKDIKIDLVYIDPPFASGANYAKKVYLRNGDKTKFENDDSSIGEEIMYGDIWQKEDYLNWLYERLLAIREVMSEKASIYVHLDWHIGDYAKIILDEVFGQENFVNSIVWGYRIQGVGKNTWARKHDNIYLYSKSDDYVFNPEKEEVIYEKPFIDTQIKSPDLNALSKKDLEAINKSIADKQPLPDKYKSLLFNKYYSEVYVRDVWDCDYTKPIISGSNEYVDYKTQKPEGLLERIVKASSDEGMIVADFFAGSGTAAKIANDLNRKFVACDIGINAIETTRDRLVKAGAEFDILKIKDGVRLFRNPAQTTQKIFSLIDGFRPRAELELSEFWDGGIVASKGSFEPVKFIGIDKKLTKELLDAVLEEIYALEETENGTSRVNIIYTYKDLDIDQSYVNKEVRNSGKTTISVELIGLDDLLAEKRDMLFSEDNAKIEIKKDGKKCNKVKIKKYFSPYLKTKIDEYNAKKVKKGTLLEESKKEAIKISDNGLELIESVQFDTELKKSGVWTSNLDLEDKAEIKDKIKGVYELPVSKFKIKIRNIAGDEIILDYGR